MAKGYDEMNDPEVETGYDQGSTQGGRFSGAREQLDAVSRRASQSVDNAPLIALAGGLAVGAALGALVPQSRRETQMLSPLGGRLHDAGAGAVERAREAGKAKFDELAGDKVREFLGVGSAESDNG